MDKNEMEKLKELTEKVIAAELREQIRERQRRIGIMLLVKYLLKKEGVVWNE